MMMDEQRQQQINCEHASNLKLAPRECRLCSSSSTSSRFVVAQPVRRDRNQLNQIVKLTTNSNINNKQQEEQSTRRKNLNYFAQTEQQSSKNFCSSCLSTGCWWNEHKLPSDLINVAATESSGSSCNGSDHDEEGENCFSLKRAGSVNNKWKQICDQFTYHHHHHHHHQTKHDDEDDATTTKKQQRRRTIAQGTSLSLTATAAAVQLRPLLILLTIITCNLAQAQLIHHPNSSSSAHLSAATPTGLSSNNNMILIDQFPSSSAGQQQQQQSHNNHPHQQSHLQQQQTPMIGAHWQPSYVYAARNRSINFTHVALDELTSSIYIGATNWLFQVSALNLKPEFVLKTGPLSEKFSTSSSSSSTSVTLPVPGSGGTGTGTGGSSQPCSPADLCTAHISHHDPNSLPMHHHSFLLANDHHHHHQTSSSTGGRGRQAHAHFNNGSYAFLSALRATTTTSSAASLPLATTTTKGPSSTATTTTLSASLLHNNYNKLLAIDYESRQLIQCGSLNQGACRKHQLGQLANYSDLIAQPVVSNDELSTSVALITTPSTSPGTGTGTGKQKSIMYVAATKSRSGPYRETVPAISARYLEPAEQAMQIIERSFTDMALVDIATGLRDYYLVNYVYAFQHAEFIYFATVQRRSHSRQLEELGYISRLARLCASDLSFQSYTEITLECSIASATSETSTTRKRAAPTSRSRSSSSSQQVNGYNYNLLQDAQLITAGSQLRDQLSLQSSNQVLATVFAQSKDHTTRSVAKSAICLFPMEKIEAKFNENIHLCYNGSSKARNMNYIAGSVDDCPAPGKAGNIANFCNEPIKLNGSLPLIAQPILTYSNELLTAIASTVAPTSPINLSGGGSGVSSQQTQKHSSSSSSATSSSPRSVHHQPLSLSSPRQHQVLIVGTNEGALKKIVIVGGGAGAEEQASPPVGLEFDSIQIGDAPAVAANSVTTPVQHHQDTPTTNAPAIGSGATPTSNTPPPPPAPASEPILADLHLFPTWHQVSSGQHPHQFAIAATPHKLVKLRINSCKAQPQAQQQYNRHQTMQYQTRQQYNNQSYSSSSSQQQHEDCMQCAQLQDPYCGWCAGTGSCLTRDECLQQSSSTSSSSNAQQQQLQVHWSPFDQIKCLQYQPVSPAYIPLQATNHHLPVEVNIKLNQRLVSASSGNGVGTTTAIAPPPLGSNSRLTAQTLAIYLAQAQFTCHFDYLATSLSSAQLYQNRSSTSSAMARQQQQQKLFGGSTLFGASTRATQARLNVHSSTVVVACPLPARSQRPQYLISGGGENVHDQLQTKLSVRLVKPTAQQTTDTQPQQQQLDSQIVATTKLIDVLGMRPTFSRLSSSSNTALAAGKQQQQFGISSSSSGSETQKIVQEDQEQEQQQRQQEQSYQVEREITLYDCSVHTSCRTCLSSGLVPVIPADAGSTTTKQQQQQHRRLWSCSWCALSNRCTFNASHPDLGCAASAIISTSTLPSTTNYYYHTGAAASSNPLRASHLTSSLERTQASLFGMSIERLSECPSSYATNQDENFIHSSENEAQDSASSFEQKSQTVASSSSSSLNFQPQQQQPPTSMHQHQHHQPASAAELLATSQSGAAHAQEVEILVPSNSRRSIQVSLSGVNALGTAGSSAAGGVVVNQQQLIAAAIRRAGAKLECLLEIEGAKARVGAKLIEVGSQQQQQQTTASSSAQHQVQVQGRTGGDGATAPLVVMCQESVFTYQEEVATQRGQLQVLLNDNQVIDKFTVILYKCHLFGLSPPALTSTIMSPAAVAQPTGAHSSGNLRIRPQFSSVAAWRAHDLLPSSFGGGDFDVTQQPFMSAMMGQQQQQHQWRSSVLNSSDCSLCANVERKYQCAWCANQCLHVDQCAQASNAAASTGQEIPYPLANVNTCPPPRIDSIHPNSGPIEGGTLLTIEGSNLGSNEREIQDKITVGGELCQLVMYSVSTRIVCKTSPSSHGLQQAATIFVGNRAGVTSAYEKFHYKTVHLTNVYPKIGPVSGGTRLYLTGSNLNIGSRVQIFLDDIPCALDGSEMLSNRISCITAPNLVAGSMRITKLTLMIDNSTHYLPYPFTYQPDPIITSIDPAESFISGGRLINIDGQHLASPQSVKLMVYHEHKHNIINGTTCTTRNDTWIACLTPAISRELLISNTNFGSSLSSSQPFQTTTDQLNSIASSSIGGDELSLLSYELGGLKLKMSLIMDDVRSVRNLDEYYHHLPHYITYFEDPQLFRLSTPIVEYSEELVIAGENLQMKNLHEDILIGVGAHLQPCLIKSITHNQIVCWPPQKVHPVYDENGIQIERPLLPIVAHIGDNLRFPLGHMQYSSSQYQVLSHHQRPQQQAGGGMSILDPNSYGGSLASSSNGIDTSMLMYPPSPPSLMASPASEQTSLGSTTTTSVANSLGLAILVALSIVGFIIGLGATFLFAVSRFKRSQAEREYKRIQLQMGSLDVNGQPINGNLFDTIHFSNNGNLISNNNHHSLTQQHQINHLFNHQARNVQHSVQSRALNYVGGAFSGKKLFYQLNNNNNNNNSNNHNQLPSFPPSPQTDISSLTGSNPLSAGQQQQQLNANQQQHIVKLTSNGTIISTTNNNNNNHHHHQQQHIYNSATSTNSSSSQSSPGSTRNSQGHLFNQNTSNSFIQQQQQQHQNHTLHLNNNDKSNLAKSNHIVNENSPSRNFNWTQEAPSTIVPYAVIEACHLTLEGKNAIKDYV